MSEESRIVTLLGIPFNLTNVISGAVVALVVFLLLFWFSRNLQMKPTGKQNMLEWLIDFTNGIVKSIMPNAEGRSYNLLAFTLFVFIFVANQAGLMFQVKVGDVVYFKSATAVPMTALTLAFMVNLLAHYMGVKKFGFMGYLKNTFTSPFPALLPINLLEQFTNIITLGLRLYGNIFAGEVLLTLVGKLALSHGILVFIPSAILELLWQGFSVFIGSIQAFVFTILTMVYISQKVEKED
ncbi:F0F1 ATP synthase subunit A [Ligilactobacillus equi]|nr:F0F1 ATP synthase subunit A [Ligilactobacillus equi]KRL79352.1 atp synthase a chain [Ligilactobacillus equi DSM 15833 = JCM 10991]MCQ2556705.1 F0F1 ATP synthase subunit A [Ligilactobacillus sp.]